MTLLPPKFHLPVAELWIGNSGIGFALKDLLNKKCLTGKDY
jgi:hypothetical protein